MVTAPYVGRCHHRQAETRAEERGGDARGLSAVPKATVRESWGAASRRVPRGARASGGVPGTAPNNESRAWGVGALSRLSGGVRALPGRATEVV